MPQILKQKNKLSVISYQLSFNHLKLKIISIIIISLVAGILSGCATTSTEQDERYAGEYVWPPPPEQPRIKWLRHWFHKYDFGKPNKMLNVLLGEERAVRLRRPNGVVADSAGNVYVADSEHGVIFVFDQEQSKLRFLGEGIVSAPIGLAVNNKKGIIFVSDSRIDKVYGLDKNTGRILIDIGSVGMFKNPSGLTYDDNKNRLYICDTKNHVIRVFDENGKSITTIGKKGNDNGEFSFPSYVSVDKKSNIYVVDSFNFRVQVFDSEGRFLKKFGKLGDASGSFSRPAGIGVDSDGHIYVVDTSFNNFQIFSEEGKLLLWIGQGGSKIGDFSLPSGMFIDSEDRIYVSDTFNRRVQVFQYLKEKK